jgi:hypothetical protein
MKHNFVAKNMKIFCHATTEEDKKKASKRGKQKHKVNYKNDRNGHF